MCKINLLFRFYWVARICTPTWNNSNDNHPSKKKKSTYEHKSVLIYAQKLENWFFISYSLHFYDHKSSCKTSFSHNFQ